MLSLVYFSLHELFDKGLGCALAATALTHVDDARGGRGKVHDLLETRSSTSSTVAD